MHFRSLALGVSLLLVTLPLRAQAPAQRLPPDAKESAALTAAALGPMTPMLAQMTEVMIDAQLKIAVMPDTAERLATFKKNLFDALVKKGFSRSEALQIAAATPVPSTK
jgi:hypothetical protein